MKVLLKNKNGITLVALAVTIVIMIILVSVAINTAIGKDGFLRTAKELEANEELSLIEGQQRINALKSEQEAIAHGGGTVSEEDTDAPVINSIIVKSKTSNSITVQVSGTEKVSGIKKIEYKIDKVGGEEGTWQEDQTNKTATQYTFENLQGSTTYNISVRVIDNNENAAVETALVKTIDNVSPILSLAHVYGDLDFDEDVDENDGTIIEKALLDENDEMHEELTDEQRIRGDVDEDGTISSLDETQIRRYILPEGHRRKIYKFSIEEHFKDLISYSLEKNLKLFVKAQDNDSGLKRVIWYYKNENAPYYTEKTEVITNTNDEIILKTTIEELTPGTYSAYVEVYDALGNKATSNIVTVSIE